jgi:cellobiose phosphorylase
MIAGKDAATPGEAKNSWLTGTAAWTLLSVTQGLLGVQPDYNGLRIDPCIPKSWPGFEISRNFRDTVYQISVKNPSGVSKGVKTMTVDGIAIEGYVIPLASAGTKEVKVEIELG